METEDMIALPASSSSDSKSENNDFQSCNREPSEADSQPNNSEMKEDKHNAEISESPDHDVEEAEAKHVLATDLNGDLFGSSTVLEAKNVLNETIAVTEDVKIFSSTIQIQNHGTVVQDGSPISNRKRDGNPTNDHDVDDSSKRARMTDDVQQPSVHITYNHLTRGSKAKLEELLQQWSQWHAQHCSSSHDSDELLESGEEVYFPAFYVGLDNSSAVSFWMDNQTRSQQSREFVGLDSKSVPLYDRGYSLEGGLEILDASRCFNCGSYNHSLKECPKPRDNAAVNNARQQQKSRRNQNANSRNPTRYYQDSPGGKYDGLKPGVLDAETRKLLGLGELDPPPWLNRMRELGYPPGYLDPDDESQPSGITIFGEAESAATEMEDGEIPETSNLDPPRKSSPRRKMSVKFPGINAPIPEDADDRLWEPRPDFSRTRSHHRSNYSSEPLSRGQYHEQRRSKDYRDDAPPGCEPGWSPTIPSPSPRYNSYDSSYTSQSARDDSARPRSPSFGRSYSDRGRKNPLVYENSPPRRWSPSHDYGSASFEERYNDRHNGSDGNYSSHCKDNKHDKHHGRSWR